MSPVGASDPRPKHILERNARISRRRVGLFGRIPDDLELWWSQIEAAALADGLDPGTPADWTEPDTPTAMRRPVGANMSDVPARDRPAYQEPQSPSARRAAALARAQRAPKPADPE